ncbi:MAG: hypothetical protein IV090_09795 [Candidatus Sericytochromatia bacterium]|nr:hypothetical protein [Candidatus Sericytochromatia bacterium]
MKKNASLSLSFFPLKLAAVAGVLTAFSALLAQVPAFTVIVRGLLAVLVFALFGQLLSYLWQSLNAMGQAKTESLSENAPEEPSTAHTAATLSTQTIPVYPSSGGQADLSALPPSHSLESPKTTLSSQILPVSLAGQPPTTGKK